MRGIHIWGGERGCVLGEREIERERERERERKRVNKWVRQRWEGKNREIDQYSVDCRLVNSYRPPLTLSRPLYYLGGGGGTTTSLCTPPPLPQHGHSRSSRLTNHGAYKTLKRRIRQNMKMVDFRNMWYLKICSPFVQNPFSWPLSSGVGHWDCAPPHPRAPPRPIPS